MKIAFWIGRAHFDLAFLVHVTLRNSHRPDRFKDQIIFLFNFIGHESISNSTGNDNIVFRAISLFSENRFECSAAFKDENNLIGAAIAIILVLTVSFLRTRPICSHVLIKENRNASGIEIAAPRNVRGFQMVMTKGAVGDFLELFAFQELHVAHPRGRPQMIHDRVGFVETFGRDDMLVSDTFVLVTWPGPVAMKPDMMLPRHFAELLIKRHCRSSY